MRYLLLIMLLGACGGEPASSTYAIHQCGVFQGSAAMIATHCKGDDALVEATCSQGTQTPSGRNGWQCDLRGSGELCVNLECDHGR